MEAGMQVPAIDFLHTCLQAQNPRFGGAQPLTDKLDIFQESCFVSFSQKISNLQLNYFNKGIANQVMNYTLLREIFFAITLGVSNFVGCMVL